MQSSSRNGARVRLLAVHTTEGMMRATALRDWKGWTGSSHASCDETGVLLSGSKDGFVDYANASWTLRSGNPISDNIEQCGWARWTRAEWLSRPKLLEATARWLADRSRARGIPLVKLTPLEVKAGRSGVIGHVDWTVGMKDGSHTDPGPNYPWDVVLARANALASNTAGSPITSLPVLEDDMPLTDADVRKIMDWPFKTLANGRVLSLGQYLDALGGAVDVTKEAVDAVPGKVWDTPVPRPNADPMPAGALLGWADRAASIAATAGSNPAAVAAELLPGLIANLKIEASVPDQMALEAALRGALRSLA